MMISGKNAQDVVLLEAVGIGVVTTVGFLGSGKGLPPVATYAAVGLLAGGLMVLANVDGETAIALGGIAVVGAALTSVGKGQSLAEAAFNQLKKFGKSSLPAAGETASDKYAAIAGKSYGKAGATPDAGGSGGGDFGSDGNAVAGSPIAGQKPHEATHQTAGLPGYPAYDYMAPAGTTVVAPVGGTIFRLSGKDPKLGGVPGGALGYSIYLNGSDGKSYFLTHIDRIAVKPGQKVKQGQAIAVVANGPSSWSSPHVHMGVHG